MTDWPRLSDAYGSAEGVPDLLDRYEADPESVSTELVDRLCPMYDTAFSASFAALPRLLGIAAGRAAGERLDVLYLAGAITRCARSSPEAAQMRTREAAAFCRLTEETLTTPMTAVDYVFLLQSWMAFQGAEVWDRNLENLAEGEHEVDCPYCGVMLTIVFGEEGHFASGEDYANPKAQRSPLRPIDPAQAGGAVQQLYRRALADGQRVVAHGLPYMFGQAVCTDCGTELSVLDRRA
ncbi:hypothetical protein ABT236_38755 [Streptomyces sp. NPDC001523]|uniref:hypothetical protein n=1 Tax=Streptomyces sp. NPDC001523 TaxID=3154383 RepID=UPI00332B2E3B